MNMMVGSYQKFEKIATLGKIRHTKDRSVIAIELVKEHLFGDKDFKSIEILLFKATPSKSVFSSRDSAPRGGYNLM
jgi:hypothetical protein